ncbi:hypothetical protein HS041_22400 [Planomonospora sp. ID67723]|uniref:hypothetical protein n=1 Tax=Planomonospora sp. ID67723 TaxID=2738134 RepID=UPI0018C39AE7|nr:hypothetical protein [Planomonospora sp. ID67723]MBG0830516.1 hypothetical protein [Planomonospora sp. ID67723]
MAYATVDDLAPYVTSIPSNATVLLDRATRLIDQALLTSVYDVDDDGAATDATVIAALRAAVCEQVTQWIAVGEDGTGALAEWGDVAIGSVRLGGRSTAGAGGGSAATRLAPQAAMILHQAELLGHSPWTY